MSRLKGKVALVTGGSRGIGRAISERLARDGALVVVHYGYNESAAASTVEAIKSAGGDAFAIRAELGAGLGSIGQLFAGLDAGLAKRELEPALDILVNNAATSQGASLEETTEAAYDQTFHINVKAPFFVTQKALPRLRNHGRIVNVSSGATRLASPSMLAYTMSKGALNLLTLTLAQQLGPRGITVNTLAPGITETDMTSGWLRGVPGVWAWAAGMSALGRVGQPADIADAAAFLVSEDARWITGQYLDASGGSALGAPVVPVAQR